MFCFVGLFNIDLLLTCCNDYYCTDHRLGIFFTILICKYITNVSEWVEIREVSLNKLTRSNAKRRNFAPLTPCLLIVERMWINYCLYSKFGTVRSRSHIREFVMCKTVLAVLFNFLRSHSTKEDWQDLLNLIFTTVRVSECKFRFYLLVP